MSIEYTIIPVGMAKDLSGLRFGKLTAINRVAPTTSRRSAHWLCKCDCGNECIATSDHLQDYRRGTKSCGCAHRKQDLEGKHFGELTVLSCVGADENHHALWKCRCSCGNEIILSRPALLSPNGRTSCGCKRSILSAGDAYIRRLLTTHNIPFRTEWSFSSCRDKNPLRFDFYVNESYLIEFDGEQHFHDVPGFRNPVGHDEIKNEWCKKNNIPLIRIPYTHLKDLCIEDLKPETSKFLVT